MKKIIFGLLIIQMVFLVLWQFGYLDMSNMSSLERQTYSIMANVKYLITIALYIAWRVTPESKPQP